MAGLRGKASAAPAAALEGQTAGRAQTRGRKVTEADARDLAQRTLLAKADGLTSLEKIGLNARAKGLAEGENADAFEAAERQKAIEEDRRRRSSARFTGYRSTLG